MSGGDILKLPRRKVVTLEAEMDRFIGLLEKNEIEPQDRVELIDLFFPGTNRALTKTANFTFGAVDGGAVHRVTADAVVATLPATVVNRVYILVNDGADAAQSVTLSPNASDLINGLGVTAVDDKDLLILKAASKKGDYIAVIGNGTTGWEVLAAKGDWTAEA